jgi:hypothetical protein
LSFKSNTQHGKFGICAILPHRNSFANGFAVYAEHLRGLFGPDGPMSALPPKADIDERDCHVRFVPKADSCIAAILLVIRPPRRRERALIAGFSDQGNDQPLRTMSA